MSAAWEAPSRRSAARGLMSCYGFVMNITLTGEQESALSSLVAAGDCPSIEEAARALLNERLLLNEVEEPDLEDTRALLAEAEADIEAGAVMTLEEHRARIEVLLKNLA